MSRRVLASSILALGFALGLAVAPGSARADEPSASELVAARALFAEGVELEKKKDYAGALARFRKVAAIKSTAIVRYHEGWNAEKLGRWIEALDAYAKAQIEGEGDPKQKDAVEAARRAAELLRPRVPRVHVKVEGAARDAFQIRIDGSPVSPALVDTAIPVDVGQHVVELTGEGLAPQSQEITVAEKDLAEIVFEAKPEDAGGKGTTKTPPPKATIVKGGAAGPAPPPRGDEPPRLSIVFGLGLGNIVPGGRIVDPATANLAFFGRGDAADDGTKGDQLQYFGSGFAFEPTLGVRVLRPLVIYGFWQRGFLGKSGFSQDSTDFSARTDAFGLGVSFVSHPRGPIGAYVDLSIARRSTVYDDRSGGVKATLTGLDPLRLKAGVAYKPLPLLTLLGYAWGSFGTYSSFEYVDVNGTIAQDVDRTATHWFAGVGVGATYEIPLAK